MRIKSGVWYWLAVASGAVGMLYALGFAGSIEALGARLSAASTSTAATPAPKRRSTGRTGGTHERKKARRCWNTGEPAGMMDCLRPSSPMIAHQKGFCK